MATTASSAIVGRPSAHHLYRRLRAGVMSILALAAAMALTPTPADAQGRTAPPAELKQITNDLYFFYELDRKSTRLNSSH